MYLFVCIFFVVMVIQRWKEENMWFSFGLPARELRSEINFIFNFNLNERLEMQENARKRN